MEKENKKGDLHHHNANHPTAPSKGTKKKNRTNISICQLKRVFKEFSKVQKSQNDKISLETYKKRLQNESIDKEFAKKLYKEDLQMFKDSFFRQIASIETGETDRILKHLGIIQNNKVKIDRLETAVKTVLLLINFPENKDDNVFFWVNMEIWKSQMQALRRFIHGGKI